MAVLTKGGSPKLKKMSTAAKMALHVEKNGDRWCFLAKIGREKRKSSNEAWSDEDAVVVAGDKTHCG